LIFNNFNTNTYLYNIYPSRKTVKNLSRKITPQPGFELESSSIHEKNSTLNSYFSFLSLIFFRKGGYYRCLLASKLLNCLINLICELFWLHAKDCVLKPTNRRRAVRMSRYWEIHKNIIWHHIFLLQNRHWHFHIYSLKNCTQLVIRSWSWSLQSHMKVMLNFLNSTSSFFIAYFYSLFQKFFKTLY